MPHSPSAVSLAPIDSTTIPHEDRQLLDDRTIVLNETQEQTTGAALPLNEQLGHLARHPAGQGDLHIMVDTDQPQTPLHPLPALPSPATRIPPEILAYIFELYVACGIESTPVLVPEQGLCCIVLVCKLWRAIAESDPRLWTSIHLYFPESRQSREEDVQKVKPVFDLHLKRSGALPISLTFTDHRIYHSETEDLVSLLVDRLRSHARRWKRISLQLSCGYFPLLFTFTPCDLSSLEHLDISGDVMVQRTSTTLCLNLESALNLKSFSYSGPWQLVDDTVQLQWGNLAEVSFGFVPHNGTSSTLSRHFRHLIQGQNITTCSLGIDQPVRRLNNGHSITLACLQTLRVRRHSPDADASTAIDPLILPQLHTLEIDASFLVGWNERWHTRTFSNLLARSGCTLRHLSIQDVDFPNAELIRCLELSRELTSFRFIPCPRSQNIGGIIRILNVSRATRARGHRHGHVSSNTVVPQLREITLASSIEENLDLMMKMFRSRAGARARAAGVVTLRRVRVVFFDLWHNTDTNRVNAPRTRLGSVASLRAEVAQWVSEDKNGHGEEGEDGDELEASVVVDSPYLTEYIDVQ